MRAISLSCGIVAALMVLLASCSSNLDTTSVPMSTSALTSQASVVRDLDQALTDYRQSIGKAPIDRHAALDKLAMEHCLFMAQNRGKFNLGSKNISHYGFEERALLAQRQYGLSSVAENVAGGVIQGNIASQLTGAWTGSKRHLYNLNQNWDVTGIGVYVADDGMVYATQIFAIKSNSQMKMVDRFRQF